MENAKKIRIIVLAAGKGVRMQSEAPKVLSPLWGKPMVSYLLESIAKSGVDERPVIVVGYKKEEVIKELGDKYDYVVQNEQLGTGHAVMSAKSLLENNADNVMVLPGDHPYLTPETIKKLANKHLESGGKITMATVKLPDFEDWRSFFYTSFSRIIRSGEGEIVNDVQFKDATEEEKEITEVNPIYFCFNARWLWENIKTVGTNNAQKEYYLTDLVKIAIKDGTKIESIDIDPSEALAANSKEELELLEKLAP